VIDLHLHTTASDGRLAPADLAALAAAAGLTVISVTDHDTVAGLGEARQAADRLGLRLVPGIEITSVENGRDVHVLGYFFDPDCRALAEFLREQRIDRIRHAREMAGRLGALGCAIDIEPVLGAAERESRSIGRPLLADALAAGGHAADRRDAFDRFLAEGRPAFVPRRGPRVGEVVNLLATAGGIASLAHPGRTALDDRIAEFAQAGVAALEARHCDHDALTEARYRQIARDLGLAVSGGSDFHAEPSQHIDALGLVTLGFEDFAALEARAPKGRSLKFEV
jgi:hypothetical protein